MKICTVCKIEKDDDQFAWKKKEKGRRAANCKTCQKVWRDAYYKDNRDMMIARVKERRQEIRQKLWEYKHTIACIDCGLQDPIVIEFDHPNDDKSANVADMVASGCSWELVLTEIVKCHPVCANCHRRRTWKRGGWRRDAVINVDVM